LVLTTRGKPGYLHNCEPVEGTSQFVNYVFLDSLCRSWVKQHFFTVY